MNLFKNLIAIFVLSLAFITGANAATTNLGTLSAGTTTFTPASLPAGTGSFIDTYNFTLGSTFDAGIGGSALNFSVGLTQILNISGFTLSLFDSSNTLLGAGTNYSISNLVAGNYSIKATGNVDGVFGGLYSGAISLAPVPEADTYAMMLASLGLVGFLSRRRKA